jgi:hypothetical protein
MGFHPEWPEIAAWIERSQQILIKKLSKNDCSWADRPENGHQNGFFIPREIAESSFFPDLKSSNPAKPHIFDCEYQTFWPSSGEIKNSRIKYYSLRSPGVPGKERPRYEWHHTGVPKEQFQELSPASVLIVGKFRSQNESASHWFIVIDSVSDEAEIIETFFSLDANFHFGLFAPDTIPAFIDDEDRLIAELREALKTGNLNHFAASQVLPSPIGLAVEAQKSWMTRNDVDSLSPYKLSAPGDAVMAISRDIEFDLYRKAELRQRASQALSLLAKSEDLVSSLVRGFKALDQLFLSAAQTRKSRAGLSFEHHVKRMLVDGRIQHEAQTPVGGRRPDFILPNVATLNLRKPEALILSLKTTLRERWKQLGLERRHSAVFLATVDDRISMPAIEEMARNEIVLVVPESLKKSKEAVYSESSDVITFRQFFDDEIRTNRPNLILNAE